MRASERAHHIFQVWLIIQPSGVLGPDPAWDVVLPSLVLTELSNKVFHFWVLTAMYTHIHKHIQSCRHCALNSILEFTRLQFYLRRHAPNASIDQLRSTHKHFLCTELHKFMKSMLVQAIRGGRRQKWRHLNMMFDMPCALIETRMGMSCQWSNM